MIQFFKGGAIVNNRVDSFAGNGRIYGGEKSNFKNRVHPCRDYVDYGLFIYATSCHTHFSSNKHNCTHFHDNPFYIIANIAYLDIRSDPKSDRIGISDDHRAASGQYIIYEVQNELVAISPDGKIQKMYTAKGYFNASSDGRWIFDGKFIYDLNTHSIQDISSFLHDCIFQTMSPDGKEIVVSCQQGGALYILNLLDGSRILISKPSGNTDFSGNPT